MTTDKKTTLIILLLALVLSMLILLNQLNTNLLWDENSYLSNAKSHLSQVNYEEDFRFPLLEWIIALVWGVSGESIFIAKLIIMLFAIGIIYLLSLISKEYFNNLKIQILLLFSIALSPLILIWGFRVYTDIMMVFFIVLAFLMLIKTEKNKNILYPILTGLISGLAFLSRFNSLLFFMCILGYLTYKKEYKKLILVVIGFIIALMPWLIYNSIHYHDIIWDLKSQYNIVEAWTIPQPIIMQIKNIFLCTGIISIFAIIGIYSYLKECIRKKQIIKNQRFLGIVYTLVSICYLLLIVNMKYSRYLLLCLPFIYILGFDGYAYISSYLKRKKISEKFLLILIILNIIVIFIIGLVTALIPLSCEGDSIKQTIAYLQPQADNIRAENGTILSNFWPYIGYNLNIKTASLWSNNPDDFLDIYKLRYLVYSDRGGDYYNLTALDKNSRFILDKKFEDKCQKISIYKVR